jgi:ABC-type multidrug transport system ATPase subunit
VIVHIILHGYCCAILVILVVIEAKGVSKAYGPKVLMNNLNFNIPVGAIVGVVGPNGAGR